MTVEYEPAPKPAPLWLLPVVVALLALGLLWFVQHFTDREVGAFGGRAQPATPIPTRLADGSPLPEVPEALTGRFGDEVVLAQRLREAPPEVEQSCDQPYAADTGPALSRLQALIDSGDASGIHLGPDALTYLSVAVAAEVPPGYPREVEVSCVARRVDDQWRMPRKPLLDFALDGRPGAHMEDPDLRTRLVQVPIGARWAVQPRGGWWLAYDVRDTSWALMTLNAVTTERDPLRVTFIDDTGAVVAERAVGPTRSASEQDHSANFELVAGDIRPVLSRLERSPIRTCDPHDNRICVWLALDEQQEVVAFAGFGPHPLDTPPMGYVGYCEEAQLLQGSVTTTQFRTDGTWAGGPVDRGLDRYGVRFEAGKVVIDLSEHVVGDRATGDPVKQDADCIFTTNATGKPVQ
jgi:hypothetical protein